MRSYSQAMSATSRGSASVNRATLESMNGGSGGSGG